jgi:hypothetical protein
MGKMVKIAQRAKICKKGKSLQKLKELKELKMEVKEILKQKLDLIITKEWVGKFN